MKGISQKRSEGRKWAFAGRHDSGSSPERTPRTRQDLPRRKEPPRRRKVEFQFPGIQGREVFLSGDFNEWNPHIQPLKRSRNGRWKAVLPLMPGRYEFKLLADGAWIEGAACEVRLKGTQYALMLPTEAAPNSFGTLNFAVVVR